MLTTTKKKKKISIYSSRLKLHDSSVAFIKSIPPSLSLSLSLSNKHQRAAKTMSRHRRQASQVLPPGILAGNEPLVDFGQATAGADSTTHVSSGATTVAVINETSKSNPPINQHNQDQASHFPPNAKKPLSTGKPA
jgi:hypothetical protein